MLLKEIVDARTDGRTMDDGQWAITKAHLEHFMLRWAKNPSGKIFNMLVEYSDKICLSQLSVIANTCQKAVNSLQSKARNDEPRKTGLMEWLSWYKPSQCGDGVKSKNKQTVPLGFAYLLVSLGLEACLLLCGPGQTLPVVVVVHVARDQLFTHPALLHTAVDTSHKHFIM